MGDPVGQDRRGDDDHQAAAQERAQQLGIPRMYAANLVPLLRAQVAQADAASVTPEPTVAQKMEIPHYRREQLLRQEVETLSRKVAFRRGRPFKDINIDLLREGHPKRAKATVEELEAMRRTLLGWLGE